MSWGCLAHGRPVHWPCGQVALTNTAGPVSATCVALPPAFASLILFVGGPQYSRFAANIAAPPPKKFPLRGREAARYALKGLRLRGCTCNTGCGGNRRLRRWLSQEGQPDARGGGSAAFAASGLPREHPAPGDSLEPSGQNEVHCPDRWKFSDAPCWAAQHVLGLSTRWPHRRRRDTRTPASGAAFRLAQRAARQRWACV